MSAPAEPISTVLPVRTCEVKTPDGAVCIAIAKWMPILLLYPSVLHGPSKPMTIQVDLAVCDGHRDQLKVKDVATDAIYQTAEKACSNAGTHWPERTLTRLKFLPYATTPLGKIKNRERAEAN